MEQQRLPILITTVDLGEGNAAQVKLWEGDDPKVRLRLNSGLLPGRLEVDRPCIGQPQHS